MFCWNLLKIRITISLYIMQKERVVEPKAERSLVDSHKSSVRESVWWAWPQPFARCIDLKCCKFLTQLWWFLPGWRGLPINSIKITF